MRTLGNYILRGQLEAVSVVSLLTFISLKFLSPFSYLLSGVPTGLVILRKGPVYGLQVMLLSLLVVLIFSLLVNIELRVVMIFMLAIWVPIYLCCCVLRFSQSHGWLVLMAGAIGLIYVIIVHVFVGDVAAGWQKLMEHWLDNALSKGDTQQYREAMIQLAPFMNMVMAGGIVTSLVTAVFISRWWQAMLFNAGGFKAEFYALQLPGIAVVVMLAGVGLLYAGNKPQGSLGQDVLGIAIFLYLFQGISVVHRFISEKNISDLWLVIMYILLFFIPQAVLFIACLGLIDSWLNKRTPNEDGQDSDSR